MIRIAGINKNDYINGEGISVSLFLQGCPFHCEGCHNPETWDENGGNEVNEQDLIKEIIEAICANGIIRNLSILGGEPFSTPKKILFINELIKQVKQKYPNIIICIWTGFTYETLKNGLDMQYILENINYLIDYMNYIHKHYY